MVLRQDFISGTNKICVGQQQETAGGWAKVGLGGGLSCHAELAEASHAQPYRKLLQCMTEKERMLDTMKQFSGSSSIINLTKQKDKGCSGKGVFCKG